MNPAPDELSANSAAGIPDDFVTLHVAPPTPAEMPEDLATLIVAKPLGSLTQTANEGTSPLGANPAAAVPFVFGRRIAQGGMGAILEASDCKLGRTVAVKVMLSDAGGSEEQKQRFIQEAAVLGRLEHPNIVPIHDLGLDAEGQLYYTMKLVKGVTLQRILDDLRKEEPEARAHYTLDRLLTIFRKVCDALAFAHAQNIIHRDLKPENIMVGEFGEVLVMDWGIAKILDSAVGRVVPSPPREVHEPAHSSSHERSATAFDDGAVRTQRPTSLSATMDGAVMGTPNYMSPEQAMGKVNEMDARSDIFSLGGILYAVLTLRPPVEGKDVWEVLEKVQMANITSPTMFGAATNGKSNTRAKGEALEAQKIKPLPHVPAGRVPPALSAVAMKALTLDKTKRYQNVAAFSADIEKYQGGFATSAEKAGAWKQFTLFVKRHQAASIGVAAVLLIGSTLGMQAFIAGRRAERALTDLKASAPALLQLAESEADSQRFASALGKLDAALALDPALLRARWQRAWVLLALERWSAAAAALRLARQHDPAGEQLASILPVVEKVAAASEAGRWQSDAAREVFAHLQTVAATGPMFAIAAKLKLGAVDRLKLINQRLLAAFGNNDYSAKLGADGTISLGLLAKPLRSLEPLRSLPIDALDLNSTPVADLEPLRGMRLKTLWIGFSKITDLTPLAGMPLSELSISGTSVSNIEALRGMPITRLSANSTNIVDWSPLKGAPIRFLNIGVTRGADLSFVKGMPLSTLMLVNTRVSDITALQGLPLEELNLQNTPVTDLSSLKGAPLKELNLHGCRNIKDYTPVLTLPRLERLHCDVLPAALLPLRESATLQSIEADAYPGEGAQGARPVADFWRAYDAHQAAAKK